MFSKKTQTRECLKYIQASNSEIISIFLRETLKGILQGMRESKIVALFKIVSEQDCMSCHRRLIFMTWYHVLMFVLVEQLWNGME